MEEEDDLDETLMYGQQNVTVFTAEQMIAEVDRDVWLEIDCRCRDFTQEQLDRLTEYFLDNFSLTKIYCPDSVIWPAVEYVMLTRYNINFHTFIIGNEDETIHILEFVIKDDGHTFRAKSVLNPIIPSPTFVCLFVCLRGTFSRRRNKLARGVRLS